MLQTPEGIGLIASVSELRIRTVAVIEQAGQSGGAVLIVRNLEPIAVVLTVSRFEELTGTAVRLD